MSLKKKKISITFDLENHLVDQNHRYKKNTHRILDFFDEYNVKATFFVVGDIALESPELIREISCRGHEIGFHGMNHTALEVEGLDLFHRNLVQGRMILQDLIGKEIAGFRAPMFSMTKDTPWASEVILEAGFKYSSSVLPVTSPIYGYVEAPNSPFKWPCGLIELPVPVEKLGLFELPFLGGIYLRYIPMLLAKRLIKKVDSSCLWTYLHPYDIDTSEPFSRMRDTSLLTSILLWMNRGSALDKLSQIIRNHNLANPLGLRYDDGEFDNVKAWDLKVKGE